MEEPLREEAAGVDGPRFLLLEAEGVEGVAAEGLEASGLASESLAWEGFESEGLEAAGFESEGLEAAGFESEGLFEGVGARFLEAVVGGNTGCFLEEVVTRLVEEGGAFLAVEEGVFLTGIGLWSWGLISGAKRQFKSLS